MPNDHESGRRPRRLRAGYRNVEALATAAGVSHNTVRSWERGGNIQPVSEARINVALRAGSGAVTLEDILNEVRAIREDLDALSRRVGRES